MRSYLWLITMSHNPYPPSIAAFLVSTFLFLGGVPAGIAMANYVAPDFEWSTIIGFMMFPIILFVGMHLWLGTGIIIMISGLVCKLIKHILRVKARSTHHRSRSKKGKGDPGSFVFIPTSIGISTITGFILASASNQFERPEILKIYVLAGTLYGLACWLATRNGYFPPDVNGSDTSGI